MIENPSLDGPIGLYTLHCFGPNVKVAFSGRKYPQEKYSEFLTEIEINPDSLRRPRQTHGNEVIVVQERSQDVSTLEGDGLLTSVRGITLGVLTADCLPVFFWNPKSQVVGIAHAGWRGLKANILPQMIEKMTSEFKADVSMTKVAFGPSIRQCCYEVGPEFKDYFGAHYDAKGHLDMIGVARQQLEEAGMRANQIFECGICTHCEETVFFSARREKTDKRILSVIQLGAGPKKSA